MHHLGGTVDCGFNQPPGQANVPTEDGTKGADRIGGLNRVRQHETDNGAADSLDQLRRSALGDHLARCQHADSVRQVFGFVEIVRREEHRDAVVAQCFDQIPRLPARCGVKTGGRLVEKKQIRTPDDAQCQIDPTTLASG